MVSAGHGMHELPVLLNVFRGHRSHPPPSLAFADPGGHQLQIPIPGLRSPRLTLHIENSAFDVGLHGGSAYVIRSLRVSHVLQMVLDLSQVGDAYSVSSEHFKQSLSILSWVLFPSLNTYVCPFSQTRQGIFLPSDGQ